MTQHFPADIVGFTWRLALISDIQIISVHSLGERFVRRAGFDNLHKARIEDMWSMACYGQRFHG